MVTHEGSSWGETLKRLEEEEKHLQKAVTEVEQATEVVLSRRKPAQDIPLNVIAREIKTMPYGDTMELAKVCLDEKDASSVAIDVVAHNLWTWALKRHLT